MLLLAQAAEGAAAGSTTAETIVFWVFAVLALGSALAVITMRNIVHGALMLVLNFLAIAGLYLALESTFLSIIQVLVYAGAIMVLFLFVIMLLGVDNDDLLTATSRRSVVLAVAGVGVLAGALLLGIVGPYTAEQSLCNQGAVSGAGGACIGLEEALAAEEQGSVSLIGERLFTRYTFSFELAALLLTVATIGATILGRRSDAPPDDQVEPGPTAVGPDVVPAEVVAEDLDAVSDQRPGGSRQPDAELDLARDDSSSPHRGDAAAPGMKEDTTPDDPSDDRRG
ncbi:NADH-quinone oxidoreductase subunit J [Nitriliruptoraceae bacterium ZYF776]|nr:NADH-quinone oxidoreductase subunit J [Profundirhabdus halotolerans]